MIGQEGLEALVTSLVDSLPRSELRLRPCGDPRSIVEVREPIAVSSKSTSACPVVCAGLWSPTISAHRISHLPAAGELVPADDLVLNIGGCASNAAIALAKLGVHAAVCGKVGDDAFGRFVSETLVAYGVDVRALAVDPTRATSRNPDHQRQGAGPSLRPCVRGQQGADGRGSRPGPGRSSAARALRRRLSDSPELHAAALAERFSRARKAGSVTVLDVVTPGPGDYLRHLRAVLPETDVFLPNTDEAAMILGETDPVRQALAFRNLGAGCVVITCGDRGAVVVSDELRVRLGAYPVTFLDGSGRRRVRRRLHRGPDRGTARPRLPEARRAWEQAASVRLEPRRGSSPARRPTPSSSQHELVIEPV